MDNEQEVELLKGILRKIDNKYRNTKGKTKLIIYCDGSGRVNSIRRDIEILSFTSLRQLLKVISEPDPEDYKATLVYIKNTLKGAKENPRVFLEAYDKILCKLDEIL